MLSIQSRYVCLESHRCCFTSLLALNDHINSCSKERKGLKSFRALPQKPQPCVPEEAARFLLQFSHPKTRYLFALLEAFQEFLSFFPLVDPIRTVGSYRELW